jgi:hypothetical protein
VRALERRLAALEAAVIADSDKGSGFYFAPVMSPEDWEAAAKTQQAELIKEWSNEQSTWRQIDGTGKP